MRTIESKLTESDGAVAFHRQLAWRDFYAYVLFHNPETLTAPLQTKYNDIAWNNNPKLLSAWKTGITGYPIVDAAMRQLLTEGWMHNRARLIVGSFLTKNLGLDWRMGQQFFMQTLIDGDHANNAGNWQWIAGVGVDTAPIWRRIYNPSRQQAAYDPTGAYVRKYVPELTRVSDARLAEPWKMTEDQQNNAKCRIGIDYPAPIVDFKLSRLAALERYGTRS